MKNLITTLVGIGQRFSGLDFGMFKVLLICIGLVLGMTFYKFFLAYRAIVWILLLVTLIWILVRMVMIHNKAK